MHLQALRGSVLTAVSLKLLSKEYNFSELKPGARILCVREGNNPKHTKAILVKLYSGEKLGHLSWRTAEVVLRIYELHLNIAMDSRVSIWLSILSIIAIPYFNDCIAT